MQQQNVSPLSSHQAPSQAIVGNPFTITLIRVKARQLCRRSDFSRSDYDELRQGMRLSLLEKAHLFDPARGNIEAFVTQMINTWVAMQLRYRNCPKRGDTYKTISLERTTVVHEGDDIRLGNLLLEKDGDRLTQTDTRSATEQFELREAITHAMAQLSAEDRAILVSVSEIGIKPTARKMGVSWRQVSNAMARIREQFEKAGIDHK